ncbi:UNVERIFIED_ORG: hypothetical protein HNP28_002173 [Comamonas terrigena]|jgi:hypothetical protein
MSQASHQETQMKAPRNDVALRAHAPARFGDLWHHGAHPCAGGVQ